MCKKWARGAEALRIDLKCQAARAAGRRRAVKEEDIPAEGQEMTIVTMVAAAADHTTPAQIRSTKAESTKATEV